MHIYQEYPLSIFEKLEARFLYLNILYADCTSYYATIKNAFRQKYEEQGAHNLNTYTTEQKETIINLFKNGESGTQLMEKYGIPQCTFYRWTEGYRRSISIKGMTLYTRDILNLQKENQKLRIENELLHKSRCSVSAPLSVKLPEMIRLKDEVDCDVHTLCSAFEVLRSTYYHRLLRSPNQTQFQEDDEHLKPIIEEIFHNSKDRFGSAMIKVKLQELGHQVSPKRIVRLMQEMNLVCNSAKRTLHEYKRNYHKSIYYTGNKLKQKFAQLGPNRAWVSDITYLRTLEGVYFLCVIIDLFSRRVIGHTLSHDENVSITLSSLILSSNKISELKQREYTIPEVKK